MIMFPITRRSMNPPPVAGRIVPAAGVDEPDPEPDPPPDDEPPPLPPPLLLLPPGLLVGVGVGGVGVGELFSQHSFLNVDWLAVVEIDTFATMSPVRILTSPILRLAIFPPVNRFQKLSLNTFAVLEIVLTTDSLLFTEILFSDPAPFPLILTVKFGSAMPRITDDVLRGPVLIVSFCVIFPVIIVTFP
jgi:hypothetical protein